MITIAPKSFLDLGSRGLQGGNALGVSFSEASENRAFSRTMRKSSSNMSSFGLSAARRFRSRSVLAFGSAFGVSVSEFRGKPLIAVETL